MATRAKKDACVAAMSAVINGHNTFAGAFNTGASAINSLLSDFPDLVPKLEAISQAHNGSIAQINLDKKKWDEVVPDDPVPPPPPATGTLRASHTEAQLKVATAASLGLAFYKYFNFKEADLRAAGFTPQSLNSLNRQGNAQLTWPESGGDDAYSFTDRVLYPDFGADTPTTDFLTNTLTSLKWHLPTNGLAGVDDAWLTFTVKPRGDIKTGFNPAEGGCKMPGFANADALGAGPQVWDGGFSIRSWHTKPGLVPGYPDALFMQTQEYRADHGYQTGFGENHFGTGGGALAIDQVNTVSFRVKLNSVAGPPGTVGDPNPDGIRQMKINGVEFMGPSVSTAAEDTTVKWRNKSDAMITLIDFLAFQGGLTVPTGIEHYEFGPAIFAPVDAGTLASTQTTPPPPPPPPPTTDPANWPDWRRALIGQPLMKPYVIAGTGYTNSTIGSVADRMPFSGAAVDDGPTTAKIATLDVGGHSLGNLGNVNELDLMKNTAQIGWQRLFTSLAPEAADVPYQTEPDGSLTPTGAHTYMLSHFNRRTNRYIRLMTRNIGTEHPGYRNTDMFDRATGRWLPNNGFVMPYDGLLDAQRGCVKHPVTEDIYCGMASKMQKLRGDNLQYETLPDNNNFSFGFVEPIIDVGRNVMVQLLYLPNFLPPATPFLLGTYDLTTHAPSNLPPQFNMPQLNDKAGATHDTDNDLYWYATEPDAAQPVQCYTVGPESGVVVRRDDLRSANFGPCGGRFHYFPSLSGIYYMAGNGAEGQFIPTWNPT